MSSVYEVVTFERRGEVAWITLNRPERANAINAALGRDLALAMDAVDDDADVRVAVVTGAGRHFCGGADLRETRRGAFPPPTEDGPRPRRDMFDALESSRVPVIAAINGAAMGGGCEIALACDIRIMADTARIGLPEIQFGALPAGGGTQRLPRVVGIGKAKELIFTGLPLTAHEALSAGLVNRVVPPDELVKAVDELASVLVERAAYALRTAKVLINRSLDVELGEGLRLERELIAAMATPDERLEAQRRAATASGTYGRIFGARGGDGT